MATINWRKRLAAGAIALAAGFALPATAQGTPAPTQTPQQDAAREQLQRQQDQPFNNAPVWRDVRSGGPQTTQVRGVETNVLVQSEGETWRQIRNGPITVFGGLLLIAVLLGLAGYYFVYGTHKLHLPLTGRKILRLTPADRYIHWTVAISWCVLAISGLILLFGKHVLLPIIGATLFSWLANLSKILHNFVSPVFMVAAAVMFFHYLDRNIPRRYDWEWLLKGGGLWQKHVVPSGFFNAGEKMQFWLALTLFTTIMGVSGLILLFPNFGQGREIMQIANVVHGVAAMLYLVMIMGHVYMGAIGVEGAWEAMRYDGMVDEAWAKEHHEYWYNEVKSGRQGSAAPMAGVAASPREPGETT
jgi:formate dehydrogenase subunit gamma